MTVESGIIIIIIIIIIIKNSNSLFGQIILLELLQRSFRYC